MVDALTFLTIVYAMADDYLKEQLGIDSDRQINPCRRGPLPHLSPAEVLSLSIFGQWGHRFASERDFFRYAQAHLRPLFTRLPSRSHFNELQRRYQHLIGGFAAYLGQQLRRPTDAYESMDCTAVAIRNVCRRGRGWLYGKADKGLGHRIGWYFGFCVIVSVTPEGAITGLGFAPGSTKDQTLAEVFLAARAQGGHKRLPSVGASPSGASRLDDGYDDYLTDKGFEGAARHDHWRKHYRAQVFTAPKVQNRIQWPKAWHKTLARLRQEIETVMDKLHHSFGLEHERPHDLYGFAARLYAKAALHNCCIMINRQLACPSLAFAELITP